MANIKAFVGHSFTKDDEQVVASFLKVFDQLKAALPSFDWTHARQAEPEELAKKVLRLVDDCNTFIAICTKKEIVTKLDAIKPRFMSSTYSIVKNVQIEWKTSDWIIQEIGLAVGRDMPLVILFEDGCRRPGGLQGNVEFIPFDRTSPERAFGQILEMLRAINPPIGSRVESSPDAEPEQVSPDTSAAPSDDDTPKSTWTISEYESSFFWAIIKGESDKAEAISKALHDSDILKSAEEMAVWDAKCELGKLRFTAKGSLSTLRSLHDKFPSNAEIKSSYASSLSFYSKHEDSAVLFEASSDIALEKSDRIRFRIEAAIERAKCGQIDVALRILNTAQQIHDGESEFDYQIAYGLNRLGEIIKDDALRIEAMEHLVWLRPDDDSIRFSLAFAHANADSNDMALHHYLAIPHSRRNSFTWNNLGVAYQNFSIPARSIEAFEKAAEDGNTLAMSNLAYRYLHVGFLREAKVQLDKALAQKEPHKNVNEAYAALTDTQENETKFIEQTLDSIASKVDAYKRLGEAICKPDIERLPTNWISPDCSLTVKVMGRQFEARGRYEVKSNLFSGLLGSSKISEYEIVLNGRILGHRVFGDVERKSLSSSTSLLSDSEQTKRFAIIFDDELTSGYVIESINTQFPRYYRIELKSDLAISEAN